MIRMKMQAVYSSRGVFTNGKVASSVDATYKGETLYDFMYVLHKSKSCVET